MEFSSLYDMIRYIQYGTNFHIGIVFLGDNRNDKCHLPHEHEIHSSAMCQMFKKNPAQYARCFRCRNYAI